VVYGFYGSSGNYNLTIISPSGLAKCGGYTCNLGDSVKFFIPLFIFNINISSGSPPSTMSHEVLYVVLLILNRSVQ
jgi:hypothetical protein